MALELKLGDVVRMKKAHACGSSLWEVKRLGADIGIACQKCQRYVLLPRSYLERRVREVVPRTLMIDGPRDDPGGDLPDAV